MTAGEAARYYGVPSDTLRRWADKGRLTRLSTKGGKRRYLKEEPKRAERMPRTFGSMLDFRERQVLSLLAEGYSPKECAQKSNLAYSYVRQLFEQARKKLGVRTTYQALAVAVQDGTIEAKRGHDGDSVAEARKPRRGDLR
jgi:excisionase family DNA binding protein